MATSFNKNNLNIRIFAVLKASEVSKVPALLLSNPGIGKTTTVYMFAKQRGYEVVELRGNSTTAEEVMGYDVAPKEVTYDEPAAACHLRPSWFQEVLKNKEKGLRTLLFLDEITTANEFVQAALLKLIFDRVCGREALPSDTLIVSAGNYANNLSNSMTLLPPVMNRFLIYNVIPTADDLDVVLNRFDGAAMGQVKNYSEEIAAVLKGIDEQFKTVDNGTYAKIGENFEQAIKYACRLIKNDCKVDLTITELQDIYNNVSEDPRVYGFISFRTLNYLRDVAIAWYLCFGKEGIDSGNFLSAIDGLCGVGLKRESVKGNNGVVPVHVSEYFHNTLIQAANDCEKLNNKSYEEYSNYFTAWVKEFETKSAQAADIRQAANKIDELVKIKELQDIERPIEGDTIRMLLKSSLDSIDKASKESLKKHVKSQQAGDNTDGGEGNLLNEMGGLIEHLNTVTDLYLGIDSLVNAKNRGYSEEVIVSYNEISNNLRSVYGKIGAIVKVIAKNNPEESKLLPKLKNLKNTNS